MFSFKIIDPISHAVINILKYFLCEEQTHILVSLKKPSNVKFSHTKPEERLLHLCFLN